MEKNSRIIMIEVTYEIGNCEGCGTLLNEGFLDGLFEISENQVIAGVHKFMRSYHSYEYVDV